LGWPAEAASFQPAIVEPEAVVIPVEDLDLVALSVTKDEEAVGEEVEIEGVADECGQTVDRFA
jgi:hypothetical protein